MISHQHIADRFQTHKLRLTSTRKALISCFSDTNRPLSYDDVRASLEMDKTTFYRNMHTFETAGLIRKIESDDKKWYFEIAEAVHPHFICEACHNIECLETSAVFSLPGYTVDNIIYKGTCRSCNM